MTEKAKGRQRSTFQRYSKKEIDIQVCLCGKMAELKMLCPNTEQIEINTKDYSKCDTEQVT